MNWLKIAARLVDGSRLLAGSVAVYAIVAACSTDAQRLSRGMATTGGAAGAPAGGPMDPVPDASAAPSASGTRLKARSIVGTDGSRLPLLTLYDSERDEDCSFGIAEDGKLRCLPQRVFPIYYADNLCTQPLTIEAKTTVAAAAACGAAAPALPTSVYAADSCGRNLQRYSVAATPFAGAVYIKGETCIDATATFGATYNFYPMVSPEPVPASAFVEGSERQD